MVDFSLEALAPSASPNPLTLRQKLYQGSPGEISSLAAQFASAAGDTDAAGAFNQRAKTLAEQGYVVDNKGVSPAEAATTKKVLAGSGTNMMAIARKLNDVSNSLQASTNAANTRVSTVRGALATIQSQYNQAVAGINIHQSPAAQEGERRRLESQYRAQAIRAISAAGTEVQKVVSSYEGSLGGAQKTLSALGYAPPMGLNTGGNPANVSIPPKGTDPKKVAAWWKTVDQAQRDYLAGHKYRELGNTNGVPANWRNRANRNALIDDLNSPDAAVKEDAERILVALRNQDAAYKGKEPVHLLAYEPGALDDTHNGPSGEPITVRNSKFAIAIGNVDTADNISVVVPGIDTVATEAGGLTWKAQQVHDSAAYADPSKSNATVAWFGYAPPNKNVDPIAGGLDTWSDEKANAGGRNLAADLAGYQANRTTDANVTAIGHSYGSTVVSQAAKNHNLDADNLVLVGSIGPGRGIDHATDLNNAEHKYHVYAGTDSGDTTEDWGGDHGGDPISKEFGATRFRAEIDQSTIKDEDARDPHKTYFEYNSESLSNIGRIVSGGDPTVAPPLRPDSTDPEAGRTTPEKPKTR